MAEPIALTYDYEALIRDLNYLHDRIVPYVPQYGDTRLAIPRSTKTAYGSTMAWNHIEIPLDVKTLATMCESMQLILTQNFMLTETSVSGTVDELAEISVNGGGSPDYAAALDSQLVVNRVQSELIAKLTQRLMDVGVTIESDDESGALSGPVDI